VNLGIAGDGPLLELATLMEYAPHLKPRKVLWFFYEGNDLENLRLEAKAPLLMRYLQPGYRQSLIDMQPQIDAALMSHVDTIRADLLEDTQRLRETNQTTWHPAALVFAAREILSLGNMRRRLGLIYGTTRDAEQSVSFEEEAALLGSILRAAKETAQEWGGNVYFIYLPARERYVDSSLARSMDTNRVRVLAVARSVALPVIDIHRVFEVHGDPLSLFPFRRMGHYNELGNQLVAQEVLKSISSDHRPGGG
jgi:hypothetical protein